MERVEKEREREEGRSVLDLVGAIFNSYIFGDVHPFISRFSRSFYSTLFEFMTGEL